jgi:membrane dipeptidase
MDEAAMSEAEQIAQAAELIDLHVDTFIPMRLFGWDLAKRHPTRLGGNFFGHLDLPRMKEGGLKGAMWSITTNPFRSAAGRWRAFQENLTRLTGAIEGSGALAVVRTVEEYRASRARGTHACLLAVQGGNCFDAAPETWSADRTITRVTLVHLLNSSLGATSSPAHHLVRKKGLTPRGIELVRALDLARIFVDLAHVHPAGFWDAVAAHDRSLPLIATHTGVSGVTPHWRNLDDQQLRAIAETGGTVGIIFSKHFIGESAAGVLAHMQHVIEVVGEDHVSIGSDYDGAIQPPPELRDGAAAYPRLIEAMLGARWSSGRIEKVLGLNFLRALGELRPA